MVATSSGWVHQVLRLGVFACAFCAPPHVLHAGHLYSQEFYSQLARVMRNGARLFHYTGLCSVTYQIQVCCLYAYM